MSDSYPSAGEMPDPSRSAPSSSPAALPSSVWLVGLSGAGKSTVGALLADRLGYAFVDLDERVVETAGETIPDIFRRGGEARFRELEAEAARQARGLAPAVVAAGGGWMARDDVERVWDGCVRVWLRVRPETAIHRLSATGAGARPLLAGGDPHGALKRLLAKREAAYAEAEIVVQTDDRSPAEVAEEVVRTLDTAVGNPNRSKETEKS